MNSALGQFCKLLTAQQGNQQTDQQLLQRFLAMREEAAFATLVERHGPMVLGVCRSVLRHAHDAEDACQATFLVLARKACSIRKPTSLAHWLHGVAYRLAIRAKADRSRVYDRRANDRSQPNPMDELTGRELREILHEELARLPESYRLPLILCYLESQTQDEAAGQLGWTAATLKGRVDRGRNLLRRRLRRRGLALGLPLLVASLAQGAAAAVPVTVVGQTARAAMQFLTGEVVEGHVGRPAALAEGWVKAMLTLKLKAGAALVLVVGILGAGAGLAAYQARQADPAAAREKGELRAANAQVKPPAALLKEPKPDQTAVQPVPKDGHGDSLPDGALLRLGSARLRHGSAIRASALSPDGKVLATAGDHSVIVWNLDTGKALHRFRCNRDSTFCGPGLAFSPDGTRLGYVRGTFFACVWDLRTGKEIRRFERRFEDGMGKFWDSCCQFANQGNEFVLCSREALQTWNVASGQLTTSIPVEIARLSPDGKTYLRTNGKDAVILGDARTGKEVTRLNAAARYDGIENGMAFSPDGNTLAMVNDHRAIQLYKAAGGKMLASFPLPGSAQMMIRGNEKYWEYRVAFSTDSKTLLLGTSRGLIHRWDLAAGKELPPLRKHYCAVAGMHTLPDGRTLVSTGADGVIRRWDLKTGREDAEPESYEGRSTAAYSVNGRFVAIGDTRGRIDLWDGRSAKLVRTLQQEGTAVSHLAFAPDGKLLAAAERSGTVRFCQIPSGRPGAVWQRAPTGGEWFCNGLQFSPAGRFLCVSDYPKQIRVVQVASGKLLWKGKCSYGEAFSPDGATLLVAAPTGPYLTMLDASTGKKRSKVRPNTNIPDGLGVMYALAFSPDGRRLAVAFDGGSLMLCDGHTCGETQRLADHDLMAERRTELFGGKMANQIRVLAFSPDSKWLASAGSDTHVYIWETATGKEVLRLPGHEAEVSSVAFSPDGQTVFSYGQDGQGYLWNLKPKPAAGPRAALKEMWADLAETDARKAYQAVWALSENPRAVAFLRTKLSPAVRPDKIRMAKLIADLDSNSFSVRDAANRALAKLAELAAPAMEQARKTTSSLEQRKRLEGLLSSLKGGLSPVQILQMRAVQALELAGTADARQALEEWAHGAQPARLTQEAQAALSRLDKHKK
jgi:RNA polymerase sigma factor (sigma-70 family)